MKKFKPGQYVHRKGFDNAVETVALPGLEGEGQFRLIGDSTPKLEFDYELCPIQSGDLVRVKDDGFTFNVSRVYRGDNNDVLVTDDVGIIVDAKMVESYPKSNTERGKSYE